MSRIRYGGKNATIMIDTSSGKPATSSIGLIDTKQKWSLDQHSAVAEIQDVGILNWNLDTARDTFDVTSFGDVSKTMVAGMPRAELTLKLDLTGVDVNALYEVISTGKLNISTPRTNGKSDCTVEDIVTFGKYKGCSESELLADEGYCAWWRQSKPRMAWLEMEHPALHARIIDNSNTEEELATNMQLWEYAVTYVPRNDAGDVIQDEVKILVATTLVLAKNAEGVRKQAIADLDTSSKSLNLDYVLVDVRGFGTGGY